MAPPMPSSFSPIVKDFINRLLAKDPKRRMGVDDVKTHPFFQARHLIDTALFHTQLSYRYYHCSIFEVAFFLSWDFITNAILRVILFISDLSLH